MAAKRKYEGPYRVQNIGANGDVYQIVCIVDRPQNQTRVPQFEELNPPRTFSRGGARQSATRLCTNLNKRWQEDHAFDDVLDHG